MLSIPGKEQNEREILRIQTEGPLKLGDGGVCPSASSLAPILLRSSAFSDAADPVAAKTADGRARITSRAIGLSKIPRASRRVVEPQAEVFGCSRFAGLSFR